MSSSASSNGIVRTKEGLFVTLQEPETYTILEEVPPYSYNMAVDAIGREYPLKVAFASGKWLLHANLKGARYPVIFELRNSPSMFFSSIVL